MNIPKQESSPSPRKPAVVKNEPIKSERPDASFFSDTPLQPNVPLVSRQYLAYRDAHNTKKESLVKAEHDGEDDEKDEKDEKDQDEDAGQGQEPLLGYREWLEQRIQGGRIDEQEQEAIRSLLDVPDLDIPVWERQREPAALKSTLMPHQRVGLTWLINQEQSPHKGGILADDMGLGKTIQAIALILARPPEDGTRKTTLIVVPTSLLRQWEREIDDKIKTGHKLKTIIYHSQKRRTLTATKLMRYDVVLTTYGTLGYEWKQIYENRKADRAVLLAPHAIFHRVILDEAHNVKNRKSQASMAVHRLRSTYRLCMTGTPLMNRLDELYPLVRFLRIEPYCEWDNFRRRFIPNKSNSVQGIKPLQVLLGRILLRRTENTVVDGAPILNLPDLTVETVNAFFDEDQMAYYQALEQRSRLKMNRFLKQGTVTRHYWYILLLILRLRQCCCHPYLLKDHAIPEGVNMSPEDMTKLAGKLSKPVVSRVARQTSFECPMCQETIERPIIIYPCGHHLCGDCLTNMISVEPGFERDPDDDNTREVPCPAAGCSEYISSKEVICYDNFADVHMADGNSDDRNQDDDSDEEDEDESADEDGNLKDFIVSDGHESEDDAEKSDSSTFDDDKKGIATARDASPAEAKDVVQDVEDDVDAEDVKEDELVDNVAKAGDSDDSNDSLPPLEMSLFSKKAEPSKPSKKVLAELPETKLNRGNMAGSTIRRRQPKAKHQAGSGLAGHKRKSSEKGLARPEKKAKKGKGRGRRTELTLGALKKSSLSGAKAKERYFNRLRKDWESSAKIDKAMEILAMIRRDFPDEKTLLFSQFTSFLDLLEIPISDDGYNYRRYDGSMSNGDREAAVHDFMTKPEVKLMLVSLRCGNAGLNLHAATRVITCDPFWNPSIEDQAIKRAHRLGQTRDVVAYRILVQDTVEDRILALQEGKKALVNNVLNAEDRNSLGRLSVAELAGLFGINWTR
ncbi:hypothetical protein GGS20DRAFT_147760 [Poronia punctata]|nr:hypothetical protein GGS20DRAFT_147760 [Poronia punctata]